MPDNFAMCAAALQVNKADLLCDFYKMKGGLCRLILCLCAQLHADLCYISVSDTLYCLVQGETRC
jgi:hypothetical protein